DIELKRYVGDRFEAKKGIRVFTSLDPVSQDKLEKSIARKVPELSKTAGNKLEAAAIAVDRNTGEIRAMVGGKRTGYD
ncbi:hypothetical protein, partial [Vibrio sp. 10N.222.55.F8]|uniref:hypothetical protein n=1 Tax=Vibrio sp. 10N.222.55.F8 TaxID=3229654 RepID=UPI00354AFF40